MACCEGHCQFHWGVMTPLTPPPGYGPDTMLHVAGLKRTKNMLLSKTMPLSTLNKHSLLTLHNLYASRSLVELIKILKLHSPYPVYESLQFCPRTHHFRLLSPKYNIDISKNNYFVSSINLWNKCISKLLDNPDLLSSLHRSHLIIPGHNVNSDMTIPMGTFKKRLRNFLF